MTPHTTLTSPPGGVKFRALAMRWARTRDMRCVSTNMKACWMRRVVRASRAMDRVKTMPLDLAYSMYDESVMGEQRTKTDCMKHTNTLIVGYKLCIVCIIISHHHNEGFCNGFHQIVPPLPGAGQQQCAVRHLVIVQHVVQHAHHRFA